MIKWFFKYSLVVFLFNTVLLSIDSTRDFGDKVFLGLMVSYAILLLINPRQIKNVIFHKAFSFFLILILLNGIYFIMLHSFSDIEALKYFLARSIQFSIISFSIYFHYDYYKTKFFSHLVYFVVFFILLGLIFNPYIFSGRYSGIIWNANALASFSSIAFAVLLLNNKERERFDFLLLSILLIVSFSTGSRSVLISLALAFFLKYGFSKRNIIYAFLALGVYFIFIDFQLDTSFNRFASQSLFNDRILQYRYAYETIMKEPIFGFGLDKYLYINPEVIPDAMANRRIGAHNGYLAVFIQYGIIFGSVFFFIILKKSVQVGRYFQKSVGVERSCLFIIIYTLFAAVYETMITGINEFNTILFWFSLAFLSYSKFKAEHES